MERPYNCHHGAKLRRYWIATTAWTECFCVPAASPPNSWHPIPQPSMARQHGAFRTVQQPENRRSSSQDSARRKQHALFAADSRASPTPSTLWICRKPISLGCHKTTGFDAARGRGDLGQTTLRASRAGCSFGARRLLGGSLCRAHAMPYRATSPRPPELASPLPWSACPDLQAPY